MQDISWLRFIVPSQGRNFIIRTFLQKNSNFLNHYSAVNSFLIKGGKASFLPLHFLTVEEYIKKWTQKPIENFPFDNAWKKIPVVSFGSTERTLINLEIAILNKSNILLCLITESVGGSEIIYERIIREKTYKPKVIEISFLESSSEQISPESTNFKAINVTDFL